MNNHYHLLVTFSLASICLCFNVAIHADIAVQKSTVEEKRRAINNLKVSIITTKAQFDVTAKDLKAQRDTLQQKIKSTVKDYRDNAATLKAAAKRANDDLNTSLKRLKDGATMIDETREAASIATQAAGDEASLNQVAGTLDNVEIPKEIT